ncbi:hypothetical protein V8F20_001855 [Naviculisporaceae sp. PSN 640]
MSTIVPGLAGELTVGHVAGIIAAGVVVARIVCPAVLTYILAGLLRDTETASTWTVANVRLQASIWTTLLRTDSKISEGTARTLIRLTCKALPLMALLTAIVGIVTPLGLGEALVTLSARPRTFEYIQDDSSYGLGTSSRAGHSPSRICNGEHDGRPVNFAGLCPYSDNEVVYEDLPGGGFEVKYPKGYDTSISLEALEIFSSGTGNSTVSNFLDIEWRQLSTKSNPNLLGSDTKYSVGMYRALDSSIMESRYKVVEGLIIDAIDGGIGFRNHTIPSGMSRGAIWEEDILFIAPSTVCVNTNLTLDFGIGGAKNQSNDPIENLVLTDRGGFVQINTTVPPLVVLNGQTDPQLAQRAHSAAWLNNALTMVYLNVTNFKDQPRQGMKSFSYLDSAVGKEFPLRHYSTDDYDVLGLSDVFGGYLALGRSSSGASGGRNYSNPFKISQIDFDEIKTICAGTIPANRINMTNVYVGCGLLRGAPKRTDPGTALLLEAGSKWSSPLYTCASSLQASIKTVRFHSNKTGSPFPLNVESITPKTYPDPDAAPLWGLEEWGYRLDNFSPLWGLVSPEYASRPNLTTVRQPAFHLIGTPNHTPARVLSAGAFEDNLAGASFAQNAMNTVYQLLAVPNAGGNWPIDLRGAASISIFRRWQNMSQDATTAGKIIDLMWTDVASSAVVGARGVLGAHLNTNPTAQQQQQIEILVQPISNRITYDVRYAIPASILLVWLGAILLVAVLCTNFRIRARICAILEEKKNGCDIRQLSLVGQNKQFLPGCWTTFDEFGGPVRVRAAAEGKF